MKCFGLGEPTVPPGSPATWAAKDVKAWTKAKKIDTPSLSGKDGKALLALDLDAVQPNPKLRSALNALRQEWGLPVLQAKPAPAAPTPAPQAPAPPAEEQEAAPAAVPAPADPTSAIDAAQDISAEAAGTAEAAAACTAADAEVQAATEAEGGDVMPDDVNITRPAAAVAVVDEEMTRLEITDRVTQESVTDPTPLAAPSFVQFLGEQNQLRVQDWATVLQGFTPDMDVDMVVSFLEGLGKGVGGALAEAATTMPSFGTLFGACASLTSTAACAGVARENCGKAATLACDTLRVVDGAWRRSHSAASSLARSSPVGESALAQLVESMRALQATVQPFTQAGWLVELCCNERVKERFDAAHNAVVDVLKAESLEVLPGGKPIPRGDYRDVPRAVRRLVRQHGNGSVTAGLMALRAAGVQSEGVKELAALLELGGPDDSFGASLVQAELEALPTESGLDIEVYYNSLLLGVNAGEANHTVFEWYDREEQLGYIDLPRFQRLLDDLGLLEGKTEAEAQAYVLGSFKTADTKGEGVLRREAFCAFYATLTTTRARQQLRARMGLAAEAELRGVFTSFASFGSRAELPDIDNARFYKLTKDCGLTAANLTSTDVDIIFAKAKAKGARRMTFDQFVTALSMCADKKGVSLEAVAKKVLLTGGPVAHATKPDTVRLHDDKSTYSGVYQRGGPRAVDPPKNDLASFLDRSDADVRGVRKTPTAPKAPPALKSASLSARKPPMSSPPPEFLLRSSMGPGALAAALGGAPGATTPPPMAVSVSRRTSGASGNAPADLREMYMAFSQFGTPGQEPNGMGLSHFQKLCRECRLLDPPGKSSGFNSTRADLIFTKVKQNDRARISLAEFQRALAMIAEVKGVPVEDVTAAICNSDGPLLTRMVVS